MKYPILLLFLLLLVVVPVGATVHTAFASDDARISRTGQSETFSDIRSGAGTEIDNTSSSFACVMVANTSTDRFATLRRIFLKFNTTIDPDATINSATVSVYYSSKQDNLVSRPALVLTGYTGGSPFAVSDFSSVSSTVLASNITYGNLSGTYLNFTLNSAGVSYINKSGFTSFALRLSDDVNAKFNGTWSSGAATYIQVNSVKYSGTSTDPLITIDYTGTPPLGVQGLANSSRTHALNLTWNTDTNIAKVMIYKDNVFVHNVTTAYDYLRNLTDNTAYTFSTKSVDAFGQVNDTWINLTASTLENKTWPKVMFTFDDGYLNTNNTAYPIMKTYGYRGNVYYITSLNGNFSDTYMDADNLSYLYSQGWDIASHGRYHVSMIGCSTEDNIANAGGAIDDLIAMGFNRSAYHLAYPFSDVNDQVKSDVQTAGVITARNGHLGNLTIPSTGINLYDLPYKSSANYAVDLPNMTTNQTALYIGHSVSSEPFTAEINWLWDMGYDDITLSEWCTLNGGCGSSPTADFTANQTSICTYDAVQFNDTSTNTPTSWHWILTGGWDSHDQNPVHVFDAAGSYTVNLTATNDYGEDTESKTNYITVTDCVYPTAQFEADYTEICPLDTVHFTDLSTGGVNAWNWSFGDGNVSSLQGPSKMYNITGTYTVNLSVSNPSGSDNEVKTNYITVSDCAIPIPAVEETGGGSDGSVGLIAGVIGGMIGSLIFIGRKPQP